MWTSSVRLSSRPVGPTRRRRLLTTARLPRIAAASRRGVPIRTGGTVAADAADLEPATLAEPVQPVEQRLSDVDFMAVAQVCTGLASVGHVTELQPLLQDAATILEASGLIVWLWDADNGGAQADARGWILGESARAAADGEPATPITRRPPPSVQGSHASSAGASRAAPLWCRSSNPRDARAFWRWNSRMGESSRRPSTRRRSFLPPRCPSSSPVHGRPTSRPTRKFSRIVSAR